jgi:hypothetical protein
LRPCFCRIGKLAGGGFAQRSAELYVIGHLITSSSRKRRENLTGGCITSLSENIILFLQQ